ncbi:hypothetical protein QA601_17405, partial [Chitinispirillales bacterium ANBcel5]|uniref:hypothetical protein n=1 Tax=Cellulosispirillum alkaliphilum TaxID=3039283 RepID=UPI002A50DD86|nr:hypothetical protein [Chitinispirillales bacterium ANBcel5]
ERWYNDSAYFDTSIAVAFEGNRIAEITDVALVDEKVVVNYRLSDEDYTITYYKYDPDGEEYDAKAIVFYFISSDERQLHEKEVVFEQENVSVKRNQPIHPAGSGLNTGHHTKRSVDLRGTVAAEKRPSGFYIKQQTGHVQRRVEVK